MGIGFVIIAWLTFIIAEWVSRGARLLDITFGDLMGRCD